MGFMVTGGGGCGEGEGVENGRCKLLGNYSRKHN